MLFSTLLTFILLHLQIVIVVSSSAATSTSLTKVTTNLNDIILNGLEGLNIKIIAPFKFENNIFGFKYTLKDAQKIPDIIFAKTTRNNCFYEGDVIIESDYHIKNKIFNIQSLWQNKKEKLSLLMKGNNNINQLPITEIGISKELKYNNKDILINLIYNIPQKIFKGFSHIDLNNNNIQLEIDYNSYTKESILSIIKNLDKSNDIIPSISLLTGNINYIWLRKWNNGLLKTKLIPGQLIDLEWKDKGCHGEWITNVKVPLQSDDKKPILSLQREWSF